MNTVAYQGEVEFDGAFWDDQNGWRVRWRIIGTPELMGKANPMKKFTKRRGDRIGTRFQASFQPVAYGSPYTGEVMLVGWADSTAGWSVTFEHPEEPAFTSGCLRRAKDRIGTRYMVVLVEVDEDENAVNQRQREEVERAQREGKRLFLLSNRIAMLVKKSAFHEFLRETVDTREWGEASADSWVKHHCMVESKADLDDKRNSRSIAKAMALLQDFEEWNDV